MKRKVSLIAIVLLLILTGSCKKEEKIKESEAFKILAEAAGYPIPVYVYLPVGEYKVESVSEDLNKLMDAEVNLLKKLEKLGYIYFEGKKRIEELEEAPSEVEAVQSEDMVDIVAENMPSTRAAREKRTYILKIFLTPKGRKAWVKVADIFSDEDTQVPERIMLEVLPERGGKVYRKGFSPLNWTSGKKKLLEIWKAKICERKLLGIRSITYSKKPKKGKTVAVVHYSWKFSNFSDIFQPVMDYFKERGTPVPIYREKVYFRKAYLVKTRQGWEFRRNL